MILRSDATVDECIARMANSRMGDVVALSEGYHRTIGMANAKTAGEFLVARLFTDAIFSEDIRAIQLIINRIDGGLPKDTEVDTYRTQFGDCLNEIMGMTTEDQIKLHPDDTVMMALCKSLFALSIEDIYWDYNKKGYRRPSSIQKQERDTALRMVLERVGGR